MKRVLSTDITGAGQENLGYISVLAVESVYHYQWFVFDISEVSMVFLFWLFCLFAGLILTSVEVAQEMVV